MNVDFVPFIRGVRVLCKPRLIFSRINGPIVMKTTNENSFALIRFCVCFNKIPHWSDLSV